MPVLPLAPDRILIDCHVHTFDEAEPAARAIAVKNGRITGTGSEAEVLTLQGPETIVERLGGAVVIPGLIDPHNHLLSTGQMLEQVSLYDCRSIAEIQTRVAQAAAERPAGSWILGRGWDESLLAEARYPNRHDLDLVAPDHPVVLQRVWNKLTCNTRALERAGISAETPDPPADQLYSGSFDREADGFPTGLFRDRAKELINGSVPPPTEADLVQSIKTACAAYNALGITATAEPGLFPHEVHAFSRAHREGVLSVRVDMLLAGWGFGSAAWGGGEIDPEDALPTRFAGIGLEGGLGDEWLRLEGIKLMPDGGMGDRTARMFEPYLDEPDNHGAWVVDPEKLPDYIRLVHDLGWPMDIHTCGSEAQEVCVRAFAATQDANPKPWLRHRIHHAYFPTPETLRLMAAHRIPAIVSSPFLHGLAEGFVLSVGEERASRAMPMRTYLEAGVPLAGSSDSPVAEFNPWLGISSAVRRITARGRELGPDEALTPREALASYTIGAAYATGREDWLGSISVGKLADLVVLDRDPLACPVEDLASIVPVATMAGGEWVAGGV